MKTITVKIAEREYSITSKTILESRTWRERLTAPLQSLVGIIENSDQIKLDTPDDLKRVFDLFVGVVASAPDRILDLVCEYAPEIASDREYIEANGYDQEVMEALKGVLALVYPFGTLISFIKRRG